ncbi:related to ankyrin [Fusarium fujikuroi]|nr:related to ankyrin [Fusarium fujikuroi]
MSSPQMYTVGWICAITTEFVAARAFFDETHDPLETIADNDNNNYALGRIGKHNVVMAILPKSEYGTTSAATVARDMLRSFPNIRFGLMVGIGGGAPSAKHDIRLGDVVVSTRGSGKGGVFQYDYGKAIQGHAFEATGPLNQPPQLLLTALGRLEADYKMKGHQLSDHIEWALKEWPRLRKEYSRPSSDSDRLYRSDVVHPDSPDECGDVCSGDPACLVYRKERCELEDNPAIHYGLIASANQLMKDALARDKLAAEKDILCFEMEAAGLMNHFPCLVIRGICDYSDSHKNKQWQGFAAMMAAAYAKDLLHQIPPNQVQAEKKIIDTLDSQGGISEIRYTTQDTNTIMKESRVEHRQDKMNKWLSPPDPSINRNKALLQRQEGSGQWFLQSATYSAWKAEQNSLIWLHGLPGCGKTILSSAIVDDLEKSETLFRGLLYFFFDFTDTSKQSLEGLVCSLCSQLYRKERKVQERLDSLYSSCDDGHQQPTTEALEAAFNDMIQQAGEVWIVVDALDECRTRKGFPTGGLLSWLKTLLDTQQLNVHLLVTSRPEQDIESAITGWDRIQDVVPIQSKLTMDDIRTYVHTRVRQHPGLARWQQQPKVQGEIEAALIEKADGMFRWVSCQLDALENCLDPLTLRRALASMPTTLDETYARILEHTPHEYKHHTIRILQLLTFSERPLQLNEVIDAIAVETEPCFRFKVENRMPNPREISKYCSSLVSIVIKDGDIGKPKATKIQLAHFSVKEYLMSDRLEHKIAKHFDETTAKASITEICLTYLLELDQSLSIALARGYKEIVEILLDRGANINAEGADINAEGGYYGNALQAASAEGYKEIVQMLLDRGADINAKDRDYGNALQAASAEGHKEIVKMLLNRGAIVNAKGGYYSNALQAASAEGHKEIIQMLLDRGADINAKGAIINAKGRYYSNALQAASVEGHKEIVQILLGRGADINAEGGRYGTALQAASARGHKETVQMLLDRGADINAEDGDYGTALQAVSAEGHKEIV